MKTINAAVRSNGTLAIALASRRDNGLNAGSIKQQSSRQMRQRLNAELRQQIDGIYLEAAEAAKSRRVYERWSNDMSKLFDYDVNASRHVVAEAKPAHQVTVVRKLAGSPFERKQVRVELLAA